MKKLSMILAAAVFVVCCVYANLAITDYFTPQVTVVANPFFQYQEELAADMAEGAQR
jgi:hypothetical protein